MKSPPGQSLILSRPTRSVATLAVTYRPFRCAAHLKARSHRARTQLCPRPDPGLCPVSQTLGLVSVSFPPGQTRLFLKKMPDSYLLKLHTAEGSSRLLVCTHTVVARACSHRCGRAYTGGKRRVRKCTSKCTLMVQRLRLQTRFISRQNTVMAIDKTSPFST